MEISEEIVDQIADEIMKELAEAAKSRRIKIKEEFIYAA